MTCANRGTCGALLGAVQGGARSVYEGGGGGY